MSDRSAVFTVFYAPEIHTMRFASRTLFLFSSAVICLNSANTVVADVEDEDHFTNGPILGRLTAHSIGIWGRTGRPGPFYVRYGLSADKLTQTSKTVTTKLDHDCTGWVQLERLKGNTRYYYELMLPTVKGGTGRTGTFRTLPDARDYVHPELNPRGLFNFNFEYACGNNQNPTRSNGPSLVTFKTMLDKLKLRERIHFAILNGDWLYETQREYKPQQWLSQVHQTNGQLPKTVQHAPTIVG
ncbi:MAG: hypothetical protein IID45_06735, partial [Planctomycetes bacterium]|nr:hypothetical protein [Planctomycetota bacterium]